MLLQEGKKWIHGALTGLVGKENVNLSPAFNTRPKINKDKKADK
jgi:hypothetical protein